jgi:hypothetical protein
VAVVRVATVPWFDVEPRRSNFLQLFVERDRALFGVNGQFATAIDRRRLFLMS